MHPIAHYKTITEHRHLVCRYCMRLGLVWQGLTHDLSKYSPTEFWRGAKYYQGYASRVYLGDAYHDGSAWEYYAKSRDLVLMHPDTKAELEKMLLMLRDEGEEAAFAYVRRRLKEGK